MPRRSSRSAKLPDNGVGDSGPGEEGEHIRAGKGMNGEEGAHHGTGNDEEEEEEETGVNISGKGAPDGTNKGGKGEETNGEGAPDGTNDGGKDNREREDTSGEGTNDGGKDNREGEDTNVEGGTNGTKVAIHGTKEGEPTKDGAGKDDVPRGEGEDNGVGEGGPGEEGKHKRGVKDAPREEQADEGARGNVSKRKKEAPETRGENDNHEGSPPKKRRRKNDLEELPYMVKNVGASRPIYTPVRDIQPWEDLDILKSVKVDDLTVTTPCLAVVRVAEESNAIAMIWEIREHENSHFIEVVWLYRKDETRFPRLLEPPPP